MMTLSKSLIARVALGMVALAGMAAAVPASAHPYDGRAGWGHEHGAYERYRDQRDWRWQRHHARVVEWHRGYGRW